FQGLVDYQDGYQPGAVRFDVGERSNFILVPMLAAGLSLLREWRPDRIQAYLRGITAGLVARARELGYSVEDDSWRAGHIFGIRMPERLDLGRVKAALEAEKVSASLRGTALRVSPNVFNDEEDVGRLVAALEAAVREG
ncbi:MAG: aminotransferase class V-fold PLP-dependent enzyme, partial [Gemmatimonadota bacterium]